MGVPDLEQPFKGIHHCCRATCSQCWLRIAAERTHSNYLLYVWPRPASRKAGRAGSGRRGKALKVRGSDASA